MSAIWFYSEGGKQLGPVTIDVLRAGLEGGRLKQTDFVWREGMSEWLPISRIPELGAPTEPRTAGFVPPHVGAIAYQSAAGTGEIAVTARALELLKQTRPWARLIGVLLWIGAGLMLIGAAVLGIVAVAGMRGAQGPEMLLFVGLYVVFSLLYVAPAIYLNRYASRITDTLRTRSESQLESALEAQKSFWKFCGITAIAFIGGYILIVVGVMVFGALS
jgi:hypothetical protein